MVLLHRISRLPVPRLASVTALILMATGSSLLADGVFISPDIITTLAGSGTSGSNDGTGTAAQFRSPNGVAVDSGGNIYVADTNSSTIRKITAAGVVTTLAGTPNVNGHTDGTGSAASFYYPSGVAVDGNGNVYVADSNNNTIRVISSSGTVSTLAGLAGSAGSIDGTGSGALFSSPNGIAVDHSGNVYVSDRSSFVIRKITPGGGVTTLAGLANTSGTSDGTGNQARFNYPQGVAVDGNGNVYVADTINHTIRKITPDGGVTTVAGNPGTSGDTDSVSPTAASFDFPQGLAVDGSGNLYVADTNNDTIRLIAPNGQVSSIAGTAQSAGNLPGTGPNALLHNPIGIAVDSSGNIYVGDSANNSIRKGIIPPSFTTLAGSAGTSGSTDGTGNSARFYQPRGGSVDGSGNLYVADTNNNTIRKITPAGVVSTFAGSAGQYGLSDGTAGARFSGPTGTAIDSSGNLYVADSNNEAIRKITPAGVVSTLAGGSGGGTSDGTGSAAKFFFPEGLAVDGSGIVYVADTSNDTIRKITPDGGVTTFAGVAGVQGTADGTVGPGGPARFSTPFDVAVDKSGNLYVSDSGNDTIRKIVGGVASTIAGVVGTQGSADGTGSVAEFYQPEGMAVDGSGNIYVADTNNYTIREITPAGMVSTLGGQPGYTGTADGTGTSARFYAPATVTVDAKGNLYVADTANDTIRKGIPATIPLDLFRGHVVGNNLKYSSWYGYYLYNTYPLVYQYYLGYQYVYASGSGVFLYDYTSGHFWYTQSSYFPVVYDFTLNTYLYYYSANTPHRHFYDYTTNAVITE